MRLKYSILAACCALCSSCITMKPPEYRRIENFSSSGNPVMVSFGIVLHNPNGFGCTISTAGVDGTLNGKQLLHADMSTALHIKHRADAVLTLSAVIEQPDMKQLLGAGAALLLSGDAIPLHLSGKITLRKFILRKNYTFDYTVPMDKALLRKYF